VYQVVILPKALDYLSKLDKTVSRRIIEKLSSLSENIENISLLPLTGKYINLYKLRISDWRVIYDIDRDQKMITIHKVGHRREIYKQ
jgi:mRNA interferase RelE/StbE